jgi:hypothetical protein
MRKAKQHDLESRALAKQASKAICVDMANFLHCPPVLIVFSRPQSTYMLLNTGVQSWVQFVQSCIVSRYVVPPKMNKVYLSQYQTKYIYFRSRSLLVVLTVRFRVMVKELHSWVPEPKWKNSMQDSRAATNMNTCTSLNGTAVDTSLTEVILLRSYACECKLAVSLFQITVFFLLSPHNFESVVD